jgi:hypothetical protein
MGAGQETKRETPARRMHLRFGHLPEPCEPLPSLAELDSSSESHDGLAGITVRADVENRSAGALGKAFVAELKDRAWCHVRSEERRFASAAGFGVRLNGGVQTIGVHAHPFV